MTVYVLTEGWYDDYRVIGVTFDEEAAKAWADEGPTNDYGEFTIED